MAFKLLVFKVGSCILDEKRYYGQQVNVMHARRDGLGVLVIEVILCCCDICGQVMAELSGKICAQAAWTCGGVDVWPCARVAPHCEFGTRRTSLTVRLGPLGMSAASPIHYVIGHCWIVFGLFCAIMIFFEILKECLDCWG